jgi:hypothetical protein
MSSHEWIEATNSEGDTYTQTWDTTKFGLFGALGFEWAFTGCMTLGGEYRVGFSNESGEPDSEGEAPMYPQVELGDKCTETTMGFSEASVYLSVYW